MINLNQKIAALSPAKRALLEARLMKKESLENRSPIASPATSTAPQLSFAQQTMWFLDRLEPNSSFYTIPQAMRICGSLSVEALRKSFEAIVARHEVLRTQIVGVDGQPQARVVTATLFDLPVINVETGAQDQISKLIDAEATRPFDLENDLMLRASLLRLAEREHILLLTVHHIAADLWSFSVLYRELATLYESFNHRTSIALAPLKTQYSDFARAEQEFLQSANCTRQIAFWKKQLAGDLPELNLPTDHPRPKAQRFRGARQPIHVKAGISNRLKTLSQNEGVTLYVTLLAAFQTLLHRYSGQEDIVVGSPIGGRNSIETENLIGYFLNTLALRTDLSGDPSFRELLHLSSNVVLGAFSNREIPFEKLVEELRIQRNGDQNPVFQTIFQFQPGGVPILELQGVQTKLLESESGTSKMDLVFTLAECGDGLAGNLEYNTDLFEGETIERMLNQYGRLLESIAANPEQKISQLNLLNDAERKQLLVDWNQTQTAYPRDKSIHQLFEEQVSKSPEAVALDFGGQELTYRQLNQRADQLAHHLRESGVGSDTLVGICLGRSFELIVGLLAILKSGGGYVPLDANLPEERLQFMLEDTAVSLLITEKLFSFSNARKIHPKNFPTLSSGFGVSPSGGQRLDPSPDRLKAELQTSPENLAYVMFTSGSTGKPKGVAVPHRAVVRLVKETNFMQFNSNDVFLQFAPVSFDASTLEIWGSLLNGAKLVIHPPQLPSLEELGKTLRQNKITTLWLTAGLFHQMVEHQIDSLRGVKQLLAGGDVLSVPHVKKVLAQLDCQLINGYGPTENTTFTCCYPIPKNWSSGRSVPIGKPIANTQVYILDKNLEPVPVGVPGELFIGGDGLARGYLNAPELNAQKFISNQFRPNARLYKTGDKVRRLSDGNIEFLGRFDHQIKLRGFRIELGEIEAALGEHPLVRQTIVLARENSASEKYLVAYFTTEPGISLAEAELRTFLEQKLPGYMVPLHFVSLEKFPLTPNGKVDRRQLPSPEDFFPKSVENLVAPRNETEQKLSDIWREVLGRNEFGIHENFFQLGGHSLLATRVASRIAQQFQIQFSLRQIFECPTIASLAHTLDKTPSQNIQQPQLTRRAARTQFAGVPNKTATFSGERRNEDLVANDVPTHANVL